MSSEVEDPTQTFTYELTCTDCAFEATVDGGVYDALDVAEAHQEKYEDPYAEHFVDFEVSDRMD